MILTIILLLEIYLIMSNYLIKNYPEEYKYFKELGIHME